MIDDTSLATVNATGDPDADYANAAEYKRTVVRKCGEHNFMQPNGAIYRGLLTAINRGANVDNSIINIINQLGNNSRRLTRQPAQGASEFGNTNQRMPPRNDTDVDLEQWRHRRGLTPGRHSNNPQ